MCECWTKDSNMRPNFSSFVSTISTMLEAIVGYLDLTTAVSPLSSCNHSVTTNSLNPMQVNSYPAVIVTDEDTHWLQNNFHCHCKLFFDSEFCSMMLPSVSQSLPLIPYPLYTNPSLVWVLLYICIYHFLLVCSRFADDVVKQGWP